MSDPCDGPDLTTDLQSTVDEKKAEELVEGKGVVGQVNEGLVSAAPEGGVAGDNTLNPSAFAQDILSGVVDEVVRRATMTPSDNALPDESGGNAPTSSTPTSSPASTRASTHAPRHKALARVLGPHGPMPANASNASVSDREPDFDDYLSADEIQPVTLDRGAVLGCMDSTGSFKETGSGSKLRLHLMSRKAKETLNLDQYPPSASAGPAVLEKEQTSNDQQDRGLQRNANDVNEQRRDNTLGASNVLEDTALNIAIAKNRNLLRVEEDLERAGGVRPIPRPPGSLGSRPSSGRRSTLAAELAKDTPSAEQLRATLAREFSKGADPDESAKEYDLFWSTVGLLRRYEDPMRPQPSLDPDASPPPGVQGPAAWGEREGAEAEAPADGEVAAAIHAIDALFPGVELERDDDDDEEDEALDEDSDRPVEMQRDAEAEADVLASVGKNVSRSRRVEQQEQSVTRGIVTTYLPELPGTSQQKAKKSFGKRMRTLFSTVFAMKKKKKEKSNEPEDPKLRIE